MFTQIVQLMKKDFLIDFRQGFALTSVLLFAVTTVFMAFKIFGDIQAQTWNAVFWIIFLFASLNAVLRSFIQESGARQLYYYTLANPLAVLFSKIIYNTIFLFVLALLTYLALVLFAGDPVGDKGEFLLALFLGSLAISTTFTFVSAIASKSSNNPTLLAVMAFPISLGIMLTLIKISADALRLINDTSLQTDVIILLCINVVLLGLSIILFPILWKN